jgi:SAM-dependent methyltransferase
LPHLLFGEYTLESPAKLTSTTARQETSPVCEICHNGQSGRIHQAREMMLGFRDQFHYLECASCGCLQLLDPPSDMARYYPTAYTAFQPSDRSLSFRQRIHRYLRSRRNRGVFYSRSLVDRFVAGLFEYPQLKAVARINPDLKARILDVGCGSGTLLSDLQGFGYENLMGVDLFIPQALELPGGVRIQKGGLETLAGTTWDLIMFHHSLEHMPDPARVLRLASDLLAPRGHSLVRIPLVGWAWEHYGINWAQLDAPRHLFLHTENSFRLLAANCGLRVQDVNYDSIELQFWVSELYAQNKPLSSMDMNRPQTVFSRSQLRDFRARAAKLNLEKRGDAAAFDLVHA